MRYIVQSSCLYSDHARQIAETRKQLRATIRTETSLVDIPAVSGGFEKLSLSLNQNRVLRKKHGWNKGASRTSLAIPAVTITREYWLKLNRVLNVPAKTLA